VHRRQGTARPAAMLLTVLLTAFLASACTGTSGARATTSSPKTIPQPPLGSLSKLTRRRLAPDKQRIDLVVPSFSHPTEVTNPLFPIGHLDAVILGEVAGRPLRIETTLLPETKTVE
jgi:hypothetical protein